MKLKWFLSTFLVALALFGISQEQQVAPNQEIVLQFANNTSTSTHAKNIIASVKNELQAIEAENIQLNETKNGSLKITYFSKEAIGTIKAKLALVDSKLLHLFSSENKNNFPLKNSLEYFNLDVFEIQKTTDSHSGFTGKFILKQKQDYDRYSNVNPQTHSLIVNNKYSSFLIKKALKLNKTNTITLNSTAHNIPEVRAGPIA